MACVRVETSTFFVLSDQADLMPSARCGDHIWLFVDAI
jgi:hypothetical protein